MVEYSDSIDLSDYRALRASGVHGTLGLINIGSDLFLCVISRAVRVATVRPNETVHQILAVEFYCLSSNGYDLEHHQDFDPYCTDVTNPYSHSPGYVEEAAPEHPCQELKGILGTGTFYYSGDFDLTNRLQDRLLEESAFDIDSLDNNYLWNQYMINPLIRFRARLAKNEKESLDSSRILTSTIRGFVLTITIPPLAAPTKSIKGNLPSGLTLISRLSCRRAGTRFNSRGIDDDGNVANFVETETIFWHPSGFCFSYAQIRGSVPLFWEQATGLLPGQQKIQITRSVEATQPAFDKHFESLEADYGTVYILNLLSESRPGEAELTARYSYHVQRSPLNQTAGLLANSEKRLLDVQFDFHAETRGVGYEAASMVKRLVERQADSFAYFLCEEAPNQDVKAGPLRALAMIQQDGAFRTNCLDCLDRTNLIQTILSQMALELFLQRRGDKAMPDFWARHSGLWADNGDALSRIYAGTGALKTSFTRHGKMSLAGAFADARKSATRLYMNNFVDKGRQNTIDMLLGRLMTQSAVHLYDPITDHVNAELNRRLNEYSTSNTIKIWVGTFNLNGKDVGVQQDLTPWLCPEEEGRKPEIVAVGFQEIVELSPQQIMSTDPIRRQAWENAVKKTLNGKALRSSSEIYVLLRTGQLVGAALMIFVKSGVLDKIKNVEGTVKKTGMSGVAGNKGAVAIRMDYANTRLCFVTAHLAAGFANHEERNRDYRTISQGLHFQRNRSIDDHDAVIWAGDFNYRIELSGDKVRRFVKGGDLDALYQNDQLNLQMVAGRTFPYYSESRITFAPTYKYNNGTDDYDTSEKARIPAWCDRVLRKGDMLKQISYATAPLRFSDHRPVYATFQCMINVIDEQKKEELSQRIYAQRRAVVGDATANGRNGDVDYEDLTGYEAISPELPPASSDRRKWWLDGGLPARSDLQVSEGKPSLNDRRPRNPFTPTSEPDWVMVPSAPSVSRRTEDYSPGNATASPDARVGTRGVPPPFGYQRPMPADKISAQLNPSLATDTPVSRDVSQTSQPSVTPSMTRKFAPPVPKKPSLLSDSNQKRSGHDLETDDNSSRLTSGLGSLINPERHDSDLPTTCPPPLQRTHRDGSIPSSVQRGEITPQVIRITSVEAIGDEGPPLPPRSTGISSQATLELMDDDYEGAQAIPTLQPQRRG
ncbi:MAG: hypothetical protein Q9164_000631 [Protoblastenia rupestris]